MDCNHHENSYVLRLYYVSIITLFSMYKCVFCDLLQKCLPKVCLALFLTTNKINNNEVPAPTIVTYIPRAPSAHEIDTSKSLVEPKVIKFRFSGVRRV